MDYSKAEISNNQYKPGTHTDSGRGVPSWGQLWGESQLEAPEFSFTDANCPFLRCILPEL